MTDVQVDSLGLTVDNSPGNQHRIGWIAEHAARLFALRLDALIRERSDGVPTSRIEALTASPARFDLTRLTDTEAAEIIADAWLGAVAARLRL